LQQIFKTLSIVLFSSFSIYFDARRTSIFVKPKLE